MVMENSDNAPKNVGATVVETLRQRLLGCYKSGSYALTMAAVRV